MAVPILIEPDPQPPYEHCCFCCKPTRYWTAIRARSPGAQVACCEACAKTHKISEVPTKDAWFEAEAKKHPSLGQPLPGSPWCFQGGKKLS